MALQRIHQDLPGRVSVQQVLSRSIDLRKPRFRVCCIKDTARILFPLPTKGHRRTAHDLTTWKTSYKTTWWLVQLVSPGADEAAVVAPELRFGVADLRLTIYEDFLEVAPHETEKKSAQDPIHTRNTDAYTRFYTAGGRQRATGAPQVNGVSAVYGLVLREPQGKGVETRTGAIRALAPVMYIVVRR